MRLNVALMGVVLLAVGGCASYSPKPLPKHVDSLQTTTSIELDAGRLPFRDLSTHVFDPSDGFDMGEVAMLAVANNPQLKQARDDVGIARAQSFAAGLLPDPQLGISADHPTNGTVGNTNAFNLNLNYDISALLLRSSRKNAAAADVQRLNLELLWQEWQVVSQARLLFTRLTAQDALLTRLQSARRLLADRYRSSQQALAAGNVIVDVSTADLAALQDIERRLNELQRKRLQNRADLNAVLGLAPDMKLKLVGESHVVIAGTAGLRADLEQRLISRPDLQALQAGYHFQEEKFRGAVLAQFPALNIGLSRARDTSGLYTLGFALSLNLPLLNGNRGNIAIEDATRKKLFDEYQNRLNSAYSEVTVALENIPLLQDQLQRTRQGMTELHSALHGADSAYAAGNLAAPDYVRLRTALLDKQTEAINLREALLEQRIALETLLGPDPTQLSNN